MQKSGFIIKNDVILIFLCSIFVQFRLREKQWFVQNLQSFVKIQRLCCNITLYNDMMNIQERRNDQ